SLRLVEHDTFSPIMGILTEPVALQRYCVPNAKAGPAHQFGQGSDPSTAQLDSITLLPARVAVVIRGVDYCRVLLWFEISGWLLNDFDSPQLNCGILNQTSGADAKVEETDQASLFLTARERGIFPSSAKLTQRIQVQLGEKVVSLVSTPREKLLFKDDLKFIKSRFGQIARLGVR